MKNQLFAIDTAYRQTAGQPFNFYIYTPPIYDYAYQYLIWWRGRQVYGYLPTEYSYLPERIDYHPHKSDFTQPIKPGPPEKIFLLIEPEVHLGRVKDWLTNFAHYPLLADQALPGSLTLQTRQFIPSALE